MLKDLKNEIKEITTVIKEVAVEFSHYAVFIVGVILTLVLWHSFPKIIGLTESILAEHYTSNSTVNPHFRIAVQDETSSGKIIYLTDYNKHILYIPQNQHEQLSGGNITKLGDNVIEVTIKKTTSRYQVGQQIQPLYFVQRDFWFMLLAVGIVLVPIKLLVLFIKFIKLIFRQPERKTTS